MDATSFEIIRRKQIIPIEFADINNFEVRENGNIAAEEILNNPHITLFSLDFPNARAVFIQTGTNADLSRAPFYYHAQRENAECIFTVSFETLLHLAQRISLDDSKLILIHSMGRSGSTLASQLFAQVDGVINMSEPDVLTQLVVARFMQPDQHGMLKLLLDACVRWLCKTPAETAWVIKGRSFAIELGDWMHEFFPKAKNLYLYRDAESWCRSSLGVFVENVERTPEELYQFENETRGWMQLLVPLIARYDPSQHLSVTGLLSLLWLSNMERYMELHKSGVPMLAILYSAWKQNPHQTTVAMMEYCNCLPSDLGTINETLQRDSQAGTSVSQESVQKNLSSMQVFDPDDLAQHLQAHAYINSPTFEVPNTLKL